MRLTPDQIKSLMDVINHHHILFAATNIGVDVLTLDEKRVLKDAGIDLDKISDTDSYVSQAFKFGILSDALSDHRAKSLNYTEFYKFLQSGKFIPLNNREEETLSILKDRAYNDVRVLGSKTSSKVKDIILNEGIKTIEERGSLKNMVSEIGHAAKTWNQDFGRISDYVLHYAFDHGRVSNIMNKRGEDALVYKDVYAGACRHCIRLYLTNGLGSKPKLFKSKDLVANGTNIGKKVNEWLPVIGATHPWCRCTINELPKGFIWDEDDGRFKPPKKTDFKYKRKGKARIKIGDEIKEI